MLVWKVNPRSPSAVVLSKAVAILRHGGVLVYPTDTAYALGGRYDLPSAIRRVLAIKGRQDRKFTLVAASLTQVARHFRLSPVSRSLARRHWPGPLSVVVSPKYAVRVPASRVARMLAQLTGAPLIATSANRTGQATPSTMRSVLRQFARGQQPDAALDAGRLPKRKPSTIVRVDGRGRVTVIRAGVIKHSSSDDASVIG